MLTEQEHQVLAFERANLRSGGAKEAAIRETFGITPARYGQILNRAVMDAEALEVDPMTVRALLKAREARVRARSGKRFELSRNAR